MGPRKISEPCLSPEHTPPMHYNYTPGTYEDTCPGCGKVYRFTAVSPVAGVFLCCWTLILMCLFWTLKP